MSSFPLTNTPSFFKMGTLHHQPEDIQTYSFRPTAQNGGLRRLNFRRFPADSAGPVPYLVRGAGGETG